MGASSERVGSATAWRTFQTLEFDRTLAPYIDMDRIVLTMREVGCDRLTMERHADESVTIVLDWREGDDR